MHLLLEKRLHRGPECRLLLETGGPVVDGLLLLTYLVTDRSQEKFGTIGILPPTANQFASAVAEGRLKKFDRFRRVPLQDGRDRMKIREFGMARKRLFAKTEQFLRLGAIPATHQYEDEVAEHQR